MNNKIIYIAKEESETVRAYNKNRRDIFFVEIDGKKSNLGRILLKKWQ